MPQGIGCRFRRGYRRHTSQGARHSWVLPFSRANMCSDDIVMPDEWKELCPAFNHFHGKSCSAVCQALSDSSSQLFLKNSRPNLAILATTLLNNSTAAPIEIFRNCWNSAWYNDQVTTDGKFSLMAFLKFRICKLRADAKSLSLL
jgi:hypothetical protein